MSRIGLASLVQSLVADNLLFLDEPGRTVPAVLPDRDVVAQELVVFFWRILSLETTVCSEFHPVLHRYRLC